MDKGKEVINEPFWKHPDGGKEIVMNTYITKQQAIDAFDSPDVDWYYGDVDPGSVIRVIESIPAADVRPVVRGKWDEEHEPFTWMGYIRWNCSRCGFKCGYELEIQNRTNFCPNCGADMRGNNG